MDVSDITTLIQPVVYDAATDCFDPVEDTTQATHYYVNVTLGHGVMDGFLNPIELKALFKAIEKVLE